MNIVIDANALFSILIKKGKSAEILINPSFKFYAPEFILEEAMKYAKEISEELTNENIRTTIDDRNETLQAKIRDAQLEKVNYMLIVGDKEESSKKISVRLRSGKDTGQMSLEDFIKNIKKEIEEKKIN